RHACAGFLEPEHVGAGIAPTAVWEREHSRRPAELLDELEGRRLLTLEPVGVERVDEHVSPTLRQPASRVERLVERAPHLQDAGAERAGLSELPQRNGAGWLQYERGEAGTGRIGGGRGGRVSGGGADNGERSFLDRLRDRDRHPAVLERAGGVRSLPFEPDVEIEPSGEARRRQQGC